MDIETQQRAINGIITSFEDVSSLRGQEDLAQKIKPYLQGSFKEPGSFLHRLLEANPDGANQWMRYASVPSSIRRQIISQNITSKTWEDAIPIGSHGLSLLSMKERAELLNGSLAIKSGPGKGTDIIVQVPLTEGVRDEENKGFAGRRPCDNARRH